MLNIKNLHVQVGARKILKGLDLEVNAGRGARHHGPERLGQEHARAACWPAATATRSRRAASLYQGQDLLAHEPGRARARGRVPGVPVPGRDSRRQQRLSAQGRAERACASSAASRSSTPSSSCAGAREDEADADGRELPEPRRQRRLLRRREEAQRDPADGRARADARGARRDRFGPRHRRAAGRGRRRQQPARARTRSIVLVTHYQRLLDYIVPDCVHVLLERPHRAHRRQARWRSSSRSAATTGSAARLAWHERPQRSRSRASAGARRSTARRRTTARFCRRSARRPSRDLHASGFPGARDEELEVHEPAAPRRRATSRRPPARRRSPQRRSLPRRSARTVRCWSMAICTRQRPRSTPARVGLRVRSLGASRRRRRRRDVAAYPGGWRHRSLRGVECRVLR